MTQKYALEICNRAASRKFSKEFNSPLSKSTVCSLKRSSYTVALESKHTLLLWYNVIKPAT